MSPTFLPDSFVVALRHPWQKLTANDIILVHHNHYGKMIKRIDSISLASINTNLAKINDKTMKITLKGDNSQSVTTEQMGEINESQIIGKVIWQIRPPTSK